MEEELMPCPACGHTNLEIIECEENPPSSYVRCDYCGLQTGPTNEFSPDVVTEWNALPRREGKDIFQPLSFHPGLPRRLKWTKEKPETPGLYLWRFNREAKIVLLEILEGVRPEDGGEWAGPIPEPEES